MTSWCVAAARMRTRVRARARFRTRAAAACHRSGVLTPAPSLCWAHARARIPVGPPLPFPSQASLAAADRVIVAPVFEARAEDPAALGAATPRELAARIVAAGAPAVDMSSLDDVVDRLSFELSSGMHSTRGSGVDSADKDGDSVDADSSSNADADEDDVVILTLGAGDVTSVGRRLLERLQ